MLAAAEWTYELTQSVAPATEPVSVEEAREHCRITINDEDALIPGWIASARRYCENYLDRQFVTATWQLKSREFPGGEVLLPKPPLLSVTSVAYVDSNGDSQTLAATVYDVSTPSKAQGRISLAYGQSWPVVRNQANALTITYTCGYGAATAVPATIKQAMYMLISDTNENRESGYGPVVLANANRLLDCESWGSLL
jgi:uncharacterized phiE125 gp8 family phage protein